MRQSFGNEETLSVTACICTYNGGARLPLVLEALHRQDCPAEKWEIVIVDSSTDNSRAVAEKESARLFGSRARVVTERRPGLSFARQRAAQEAKGEIICFLDDDNIAERDFVTQAIRAFKEHPRAGCLGGKVIPEWEGLPTPLAETVADFALAICDNGNKAFSYNGIGGGPVGAGLCARRDLLLRIYDDCQFAKTVVGGIATSVGGGEDTAISIAVRKMDWEIWYVPTLVLRHLIPKSRMTKNYFLDYYRRIGIGQANVRKLYDWKARTPVAWLIGLKDLCRWNIGFWCGPSTELKLKHPQIAGDLHELHQSMTRSRGLQAIRWPR